MELDKAIELLTLIIRLPNFPFQADYNDAMQLGVKALERVKHVRDTYQKSSYVLLPGETEN